MDSEFVGRADSPIAPPAARSSPAIVLRPLRAFLTAAAGALVFDALVFVVLALLAASVLGGPRGGEALYVLFGLAGFAVFWGSITGGDVARFYKLQRRWLRHLRSAPPPAAPALMLQAPPRRPARPLRPPVAQSTVRPARHAAVHSLSLWRRSSR